MGALDDGHGSLMRAAAAANDLVVASIFVNPLQFAPNEDLAAYPRDLDGDTATAAANGVDLIFHPSVDEMYPGGPVLTSVNVAELSARWDGASRPTHFSGVTTVVSKLFNIVGPCRAYFGEKDFQQLTIITRMVDDLSIPVEVIGCATQREPDGLAMSSRNRYLSPEDRAASVVLRRALDRGVETASAGPRSVDTVDATIQAMVATIEAEPRAALDYAIAVDPATLEVPDSSTVATVGELRLLLAVRFGSTRLIDNCAAPMGDDDNGDLS
jgi:pantoate--beta-alanine ligase